MTRTVPLVQRLEIASPCSARWDQMTGDDHVRHCGECRMNVYDVSNMTGEEVRRLVEQTEGRLCARLFRRADGTILTKDCPSGLAAIRRRVRHVATAAAALVGMLGGGVALARAARDDGNYSSIGTVPGVRTVKRWLDPAPPAAPPGRFMMGEVMVTPAANANANANGIGCDTE